MKSGPISLSKAVGVKSGDIVSLVGGGGKTTAMFKMAEELSSNGLRVIVTTTTHIFPPEDPIKTIFKNEISEIEDEIVKNGLIVLAQGFHGERLKGVEPSMVRILREIADVILVEADGANCMPFKAPLDHEPVIPPSSTVVMPVTGMDVIGRTLSRDNCHRPEKIAELMQISIGDVITTDIVAGIIMHPMGGMKGAPPGARYIPLLNKADSSAEIDAAMEISKALMKGGIERSVIASLKSNPPVIKPCGKRCKVAAVILAAGGSSRMGQQKLDMKIDGRTLVQRVVDSASGSLADENILVTRPGILPVDVSEYHGLKIVENDIWQTGQSSSMKKGLENINPGMDAAVFLMADQPFISAEIINELILRYYYTDLNLVAPVYSGKRGSPVIFDRSLFQELFAIEGDKGGRELLSRFPVEYVEFDSSIPGMDIDTPEDYERLKNLTEPQSSQRKSFYDF